VARKVRNWMAYQAEREHFGTKDPADRDDEIEENERNDKGDNQNVEKAPVAAARARATAAWSIVLSVIFRWWSEDTVMSSKMGRFLPKFAIGGAIIAFLAGTSYTISRCIIRSPLWCQMMGIFYSSLSSDKSCSKLFIFTFSRG
jgi:hypothetical protein